MSIGEIVATLVTDPFVMMLLGALANFLQRLIEQSDAGQRITPIQYIKNNPYRISISIVGVLVGYSILIEMAQLTSLNALGVGYMSHSIVELFSSRFDAAKLHKSKDKADT